MSTTEDKLIADYTLLLSQTKAVSDIDVKNWSHKNVFTEHHFYVHPFNTLRHCFQMLTKKYVTN